MTELIALAIGFAIGCVVRWAKCRIKEETCTVPQTNVRYTYIGGPVRKDDIKQQIANAQRHSVL